MPDGRILAIHPSFGIVASTTDGSQWSVSDPLNIGSPDINDIIFTPDGYAHLATNEGYVKILVQNIVSVRDGDGTRNQLHVFTLHDGSVRVSSSHVMHQVDVFSVDGRTMVTSAANANMVDVDGSNLPRGCYIVVAHTPVGVERALIVK